MSKLRLFGCLSLVLIAGCGSCEKKSDQAATEETAQEQAAAEAQAQEQHEAPAVAEPDPSAPDFNLDGGMKVTADLPERPPMPGAAPAIEPAKTLEERKPSFTFGSTLARGPTPREPPGLYGPNEAANTAFVRFCGGCHGLDGSGEAQRKVLPRLPDLTKTLPSDDRIRRVIKEGHAEAPALEKTLTSEEIDALVEEVKALKR